jgi:hypothetical protein
VTVTYESIQTFTIGSNQSTIEFTGISQAYSDLVIACAVKVTAGGMAVRPNSNSGNVYSGTYMYGNGTTPTSSRLTTTDLGGTGIYLLNGSVSTTEFTTVVYHINAYSNTSFIKQFLIRYGNTVSSGLAGMGVGYFNSTAAISTLLFNLDGGGNFAAGTTISLYGIKEE